MKAEERNLNILLIQNDSKTIKTARPKLYEGDRVVAREPAYASKSLYANAFPQALLHTDAFTHRCL